VPSRAEASQFAALVGEILLARELASTTASGLALLKWDADAALPVLETVGLTGPITGGVHWEQLVFSPAGIGPIEAVAPVPEPKAALPAHPPLCSA
jgi:hypothetical protein